MRERITVVAFSMCLSVSPSVRLRFISPNGHQSATGDSLNVLNEALFVNRSYLRDMQFVRYSSLYIPRAAGS